LGTVVTKVGDIPCGGGDHDIPPLHQINALIKSYKLPRDTLYVIIAMTKLHSTIRNVHMPAFWENAVTENRDLRIMYLMNEISESIFKRRLQQNEKKHKKKRAILSVLQLINTVIVDILQRFVNSANRDILREMDALVSIVNAEFNKIAHTYTCKTPRIDVDYIMDMKPAEID
jgi:hypothetical protein